MKKIAIELTNNKKQIIDVPEDTRSIIFKDDNGEELFEFETILDQKDEFKDGDVICILKKGCESILICIFNKIEFKNTDVTFISAHIAYSLSSLLMKTNTSISCENQDEIRYATLIEKQILRDAMRREGFAFSVDPESGAYRLE